MALTNEEASERLTKYDDKGYPEKIYLDLTAGTIMHNLHIKTTNDMMYYYEGGVYLPGGESKAITVINGLFFNICDINYDPILDKKIVAEIIAKIKALTQDNIVSSPNILNIKNGLLDLNTVKLLPNGSLDLESIELSPHNPDIFNTVQFPVIFDKAAKCTAIKKYLGEVLNSKDIPFIQELAGWFLWGEYHIHKSIMFYGSGRNGKGTLIRLLQKFIGEENCSHVSLQQLGDDRFSSSVLVGKAANLYGDLPKKDLSDSSVFKCYTGGDTLTVQRKFGQPFSCKPTAKMCFSCNNIPKSYDDSYGFFSRWFIVAFEKTVDVDYPIDLDLDSKLQTQSELSGFLNYALEGLALLKSKNWKFSYRYKIEDIERFWKRQSDQVYAFLEDCYEYDASCSISKQDLYAHFKKYADEHGLKPMSINSFNKSIDNQDCIAIEDFRPGTTGNQIRSWLGLKKKSDKQTTLPGEMATAQ
jgi:P4 family phage/plasmid primase-like protien